jgi:dTDP-4-dehydrorhamnose 3,5-epimerase
MDIQHTKIPDLFILTPARFADSRGFFCESWNSATMAKHGFHLDFVQDNHSLSKYPCTIRGLHFQSPPHAQAKLVRCGRGRLLDVAVDIRNRSPTYGKWVSQELIFENGKQLLIPEGFLHGFVTLEPDTEIVYKCSDHYAPQCDGVVRFDDPDIAIDWGIDTADVALSDKDREAPSLKEITSPFDYHG